MSNIPKIAFLVMMMCVLNACKPFKLKDLAIGQKYYGIFTSRTFEKMSQVEVTAVIEKKNRSEVLVRVSGGVEFEVVFNRKNGGTLHSTIFSKDYEFTSSRENCYLTYDDLTKSDEDHAELCYNEKNTLLTFDAVTENGNRKINLVLSLKDTFGLTASEEPSAYTLDELRKRALSQSFESRIEFEHLKQARLVAENAQLNLLPHVGISFGLSFVGATTFNPMLLLRSIGNLAPFLFPTNWMSVKEKTLLARSEEYTQIILRADTVNAIDSLAFAYSRDKFLLKSVSEFSSKVEDLKSRIELKEVLGTVANGSTDQLRILLNSIQQTENAAKTALAEDLRAMSIAAGFHGAQAISDVTSIETKDFSEVRSREQFKNAVILNSPELKQIDELIRVAKLSKNERYWNWLDPAGENSGLIGAGLPSYIKIGKSVLAEMRIQREQLEALLRAKAESAYDEYLDLKKNFDLVSEEDSLQKNRMERLLTQFELGTAYSVFELSTAVQDRFKTSLSYSNAYHSLKTSEVKLQRLLMIGHYRNAPSI